MYKPQIGTTPADQAHAANADSRFLEDARNGLGFLVLATLALIVVGCLVWSLATPILRALF